MQRSIAALLPALFSLGALTGASIAAPQLGLPKERRSQDASQGASQDASKGTAEGASSAGTQTPRSAGEGAAGEGSAQGKDLGNARSGLAGRSTGRTSRQDPIRGDDGQAIGTVTTTRINAAAPRQQSTGSKRRDRLSLPKRRRSSGAPAEGQPAGTPPATDAGPDAAPANGAPGDSPNLDGPGTFPSKRGSTRFLYDQILKARKPTDDEVADAADRLARLGEEGLEVGRFAMLQEDPALIYAGARVLLIAGTPEDADSVERRLRGELPKRAGMPMLRELLERDPVRGNERLLADLLGHTDSGVRRMARNELSNRLDESELELLIPSLESRATAVRRSAVELVSGMEGGLAAELLLARVDDPSVSVAQIAIKGLSRIDDPALDFELLRRAMESGEILRKEALLLLAIAEREDRHVRPILTEQHTPPLLRALTSPLPLVQSSAAVALSGIGFRSPRTSDTAWMDGPVPSTLVGVAAGFTFFDGFEIVREPALRRLRQVTGMTLGSDGPAWARWWSENKGQFHASRAVISVQPEDEGRVQLTVDDVNRCRPYTLVGSDLVRDAGWVGGDDEGSNSGYGALSRRGDVFFLTPAESKELVQLLSESGIFSAERLPGPRGSLGLGGRAIGVTIDEREKQFRFGTGRSEPWFEQILTRAHGLHDSHVWQSFPVANKHADRRALYLSEAAWWEESRTDEERDQRLRSLIIEHLAAAPLGERTGGVDALVDASDRGGMPSMGDAVSLTALIGEEPLFNDRARRMTTLVRGALDGARANGLGSTDAVRDVSGRLVSVLHDQFAAASLEVLADVLAESGKSAIQAAIVDERPLMRVAATAALSGSEDEESIDLLMGLLNDPDTNVQAEAVLSLGRRGAVRAQGMILDRAKASMPRVRTASLRAIGKIGGAGAIDVLVKGLTDPDERYHLPAAAGLADLEVGEAAPLLVSLLRSRARSAVQVEARDGLLRLGKRAHDELFGAMRSPDAKLRREAALLLAEQLEPRAVPVLIRGVAEQADDLRSLEELVVLTCVDYRGNSLPGDAWFEWWDGVDHSDSRAWFLSGLEQRNLRVPPREDFENGGTTEVRELMLALVADGPSAAIAERARRELVLLTGIQLDLVPTSAAARAKYLEATRKLVLPESPVGTGAQGE